MRQRLRLVSDFNIEVLARLLQHGAARDQLEVTTSPFGQVMPTLLRRDPDDAGERLLVWTRPEGVIEGFRRALDFEAPVETEVIAEVDRYADALLGAAENRPQVLVVAWTLPPGWRGWGPVESRRGVGVVAILGAMRQHLLERLGGTSSIVMLEPEPWFRAVGRASHSPKLWYASKVPYTQVLFSEAADDVLAALQGARGEARRVVVVDLDETLWGGVIGETGPQGILLGGHDHRGEAFVEFQRALKALTRRGVQLAIASKNEESVAMEALTQHPEMVLRPDDFAAWRINWLDKATNLREIAEELNLGLSSFLFIDDNAAERARIRETLPEVLVPDWPSDPTGYLQALWALRCFDTAALSAEDAARGDMYRAERQRRVAARATGSKDDWLATLGVTVQVSRLTSEDLTRGAQLFNKTNQMNLATRRLSDQELAAWAHADGNEIWTLRVADRFGEYGLTALVGLQCGTGAESEAVIVDWLLSCRVMGRCVEESMLHLAVERARARGCHRVTARLIETERNAPTVAFWRRSAFDEVPPLRFSWDASRPYPRPETVTISGSLE